MERRPKTLLAIILLIYITTVTANTEVMSLYTDKDHVLELNITNFDSTVYNQPRAFFVEFYAR
jgi:hypothetical protein